jgi:hypothetical protein
MPAQPELKALIVRPIKPHEEQRWNQLMDKHHYLGFRHLVGESIKYVAELDHQWLALLGWAAAAFKCTKRDKWIAWSKENQWERLSFIANNQRFLILPGVKIPNLASKILSQNIKRLSPDWKAIFNHPIVLAETFVDHSLYAGTCYRAAGWIKLGKTKGYGKSADKYYYHGRPKTIYVYPLHKKARELLASPFLDPKLKGEEKPLVNLNTANINQEGGLLQRLKNIKDPRMPRGIRHSITSTLAISICATLSGARSFVAIGEWAQDLTQELLQKFGCRYHPDKRKYIAPSEPTLRRHLQSIDANELDQVVNKWLAEQADPGAIAVDGKTLRGAKNKVHLLTALLHKEGVVVGQRRVDAKTNEITEFKPLLKPLDLKGKVVTADAMHTQVAHARYVVENKKADYLFTVKGNQGTLKETIEDLEDGDFSP